MAVPTPISGLPSATPASGDLAVIVHSGVTSKTTLSDILNLVVFPVTSVAGRTGAITLVSTDISNSTATGRAVLTAADAAAARTAIGAGTGNALTSGTLAQFAATTSAELASVLTDETGSGGGFVRATSPTLTTPSVSGTLAVYQTGQSGASTARVDLYHDGSNAWLTGGSGILLLDSATTIQAQKAITVAASIVGLANRGFALYPSVGMRLEATSLIGWSNGTDATAAPVLGLARLDDNTIEVNNGTRTASGGARRGLSVSSLTASGQVTAGSPASSNIDINGWVLGSGHYVYLTCGSWRVIGQRVADGFLSFGGLTSGQWPGVAVLANGVEAARFSSSGTTISALLTLGTYTVATLPSASANAGAFAQVTDSNSTTNGSTVAGGGSNRVPVFSNGTNWIIK